MGKLCLNAAIHTGFCIVKQTLQLQQKPTDGDTRQGSHQELPPGFSHPLQGSRARTGTANTPFCIEPQHDSYSTQRGFPSLPNPSFRFGALDLASATVCLEIRRSERGNGHIWRRCQLLAPSTLPEVHQPRMVPGWGHSTWLPLAHPAWPRLLPRPLLTSSSCTLRGISNMHICTGCTRAFCTLNKGFASIFPGMEGLLILLPLLRRSSPRSRSSPGGETERRSPSPADFVSASCQQLLLPLLRALVSSVANQRAARSCTGRLSVRGCEQRARVRARVSSRSPGWEPALGQPDPAPRLPPASPFSRGNLGAGPGCCSAPPGAPQPHRHAWHSPSPRIVLETHNRSCLLWVCD